MIFLQNYPYVQGKSIVRWITLLFIILFSTDNQLFAQLPSGFSRSIIQENYTNPVGIVFSPDGNQFFVWEKSGKVYVSTWNGSSYVRQATPVLDISEEVGEWNDFGLHSFCLDPNYQSNGLIYIFYVVDLHHLLYYGTPQYSSSANLYHHATICRTTRYHLHTTGNDLTTDYSSRKVLLGESITTGVPVTFESHAGGTLLFGADGTLLISTGDGGHHDGVDVGSRAETNFQESLNYGMMRPNENVGALRSQLVNSLCGKVLRIDPNTGDGIASNPFYDAASPRSAQSRVWTMGLRNPYRMSLQPNTGSTVASDGKPGILLIGDVGWFRFEDFHVVDKPGLNCGWPLYEGLEPTIAYYGTNVHNLDEPGQPTFESLCVQPTSFVDNADPKLRRFTHHRPDFEYNHDPTAPRTRIPAFSGTTPITRTIGTIGAPAGTSFFGFCLIGGVYYTGNQFPASYKNTYFFTDQSQGWIKNVVLDNENDIKVQGFQDFAPDNFDTSILSMKMNPRDGSIYYVQIQGRVSRISYGGNQPPVATASSNVTYGSSPLSVQFTGSNSVDPEGFPLSYQWNFGDGTTSTAANPTHIFSSTGTGKFTVTLVVTDNQGQASTPKELVISVNNTPPTVQITNPAPGTLYSMSQATSYTLQSNVVDNDPSNLKYEWQVSLHHNIHTHPEPVLTSANPVITISPVGCSPNETYSYVITLKVTDNGGLTATSSVILYPDCNSASSLVSNLTPTRQLNAVNLNWINPNVAFDEVLVAAKAADSFSDKPSGMSYTADANFMGNGSPIEGGKVVYSGKGTNVTVTNLNPLFQYYFRVYTRVGNTWNGGVEVSAIPNLAPVAPNITAPAAPTGQYYSFTVPTFTDPEGQNLVYSATGLPSWLSFDAGSRTLAGVPTQTASYTISIVATDPGNLNTALPLIISTGPNQAPIAPTVPIQAIATNQPYSYTLPAFIDPEGQNLTYSVSSLPSWLTFNLTTRVLSGTPSQAGSYLFSIAATDPSGLTTSVRVSINVAAGSPDLTPILYLRSSLVNNVRAVSVVVDVVELKSIATSGSIKLSISRDAQMPLTFNGQATSSPDGRSVQNSAWSFDSSDPSYYVLTTTQVIKGGDVLSVGLTGSLVTGATSGILTVSAVIEGGSGGETKWNNNVDIEKIEYFQQ